MDPSPTQRLAAAASTLAIILALFSAVLHGDAPCIDGTLLARAATVTLR